MSGLGVIVLAAGQGTRMKSALPKVLHTVCGSPMVSHVIAAARGLEPDRVVVVVGHGGDQVRSALAGEGVTFVEQTELLGTADAVRRCKEALAGCSRVLVLNGDEPLVTTATLRRLLDASEGAPVAFVTQVLPDGGALGRVVRNPGGSVTAIVQAADFEGPQGQAEINWGEYLFDAPWLWDELERVPLSPKGEYYLTKLADFAFEQGKPAATIPAEPGEALGVDDRVKLALAEAAMRRRILERHMLAGVTIADPATVYIDATVEIGPDSTILPNCHLLGMTRVAANTVIGPGTTLRNSEVGANSRVQGSVIEESRIGERCTIGPFSHLRGNAVVGDDCEIHNYAEIKNSTLGRNVKMHHFSYLGDAEVGENTNIAAGAITCNYDGVAKHRTTIGRNVFVGCDTMLVAPVTLGDGSLTAAGSVVTKDVGPGERVAGVPARPLPPKRAAGE